MRLEAKRLEAPESPPEVWEAVSGPSTPMTVSRLRGNLPNAPGGLAIFWKRRRAWAPSCTLRVVRVERVRPARGEA